MLNQLKILDVLSDPSKLLHLTRGHTAQHDSVVRIKSSKKMLELLLIEPFFIGIKELKGFSRLAHIVSTIDS